MTAIIGFSGPGYGLLAIDRNVIRRRAGGEPEILSSSGGKLHAGPDGFFAGSGKARLLANVARTVHQTTEPDQVGRAMRMERKSRYARRPDHRRAPPPETSFGVLLRRTPTGPDVWVLRPEEGYRPELVPPGRPLVTGPEDPEMRPLIGAFRLLFAPTPGEASLARNLDLVNLYFWLRHRLTPSISADFDVAVVTGTFAEMATRSNELEADPERAAQVGEFLKELGHAFRDLARMVRQGVAGEDPRERPGRKG